VIALSGAAAWPAVSDAHAIRHQTSANWAGYADTARVSLREVSAEWVQPRATCNRPYATYSAFWVGLGGFEHTSHAIEQVGTEADCAGPGRSTTYAWYELVPSPSVKLRLPVRPGNLLKARVITHGRQDTLSLVNLSTGHRFRKSVRMTSPDESSAEWIAEAPSACVTASECQPLPLSDFGTVSFSHAEATTTRGHAGTITDPAFSATELTLSPGGPVIGPMPVAAASSGEATPSAPTQSGGAFSVTYEQTASPSPPPPFEAANRVRHGITAP
jgi:hypothetical protein